MPLSFPDAPSVNDTYTAGDITYSWNGTVWRIAPETSYLIEYLVVGGGGGGGARYMGGGGGAGGYKAGTTYSPVGLSASIDVSVGAGGAGGSAQGLRGTTGTKSVFDYTLAFGGGGGGGYNVNFSGDSGASGGGASGYGASGSQGRAFFDGEYGNDGAYGQTYGGGGGGGAGAAGSLGSASDGGVGGDGLQWLDGNYYAGGGGGGDYNGTGTNAGGAGGGGYGANGPNSSSGGTPGDGTANTGGGGGGTNGYLGTTDAIQGGDGGSGIVAFRYADTHDDPTFSAGLTYTSSTSGGYKYFYVTAGTGTVTW